MIFTTACPSSSLEEECGVGPLGSVARSKLSSVEETSPFFKLNTFLASKAGVEQTSTRMKKREIELDLAMYNGETVSSKKLIRGF